jgi:hypothetical protein
LTSHAGGDQPAFPPEVAAHLVKLACELPDKLGRSVSLWTCEQLATQLSADGVVESISAQSVQRLLEANKLKPWRVHFWRSPKTPGDDAFRERVLDIMELYTRQLGDDEMAYSLDEKTSLQPRTRSHETKPPQGNNRPALLEHEYTRKGALQLFAAFNIRSGEVIGILRKRKRQSEFIELLEAIDSKHPEWIRVIHLVCDNVSVHHGKQVRKWLTNHPRFQMHFTPVHCSWMNQVEQWFSILQRRRLCAPNFEDLADLELKINAFIEQWNEQAHPLRWTKRSFDKVLAKIDAALPKAA